MNHQSSHKCAAITIMLVPLLLAINCGAVSLSIAHASNRNIDDSTSTLILECEIKNNSSKTDSIRMMTCSFSDNITQQSNIHMMLFPENCTSNASKTTYLRPQESLFRTATFRMQSSKIDSTFWVKLGLMQCLPNETVLRNFSKMDANEDFRAHYIDTSAANIIWTKDYLINVPNIYMRK